MNEILKKRDLAPKTEEWKRFKAAYRVILDEFTKFIEPFSS